MWEFGESWRFRFSLCSDGVCEWHSYYYYYLILFSFQLKYNEIMWLLASCFLPFKFAVLLFFSSAKGSMFTLAKSYLWILWHLQHLPHRKNNKVKDQIDIPSSDSDILTDMPWLIWISDSSSPSTIVDIKAFKLSDCFTIIELWIPVLVEITSDRLGARPSVQPCFSLRSTQLNR